MSGSAWIEIDRAHDWLKTWLIPIHFGDWVAVPAVGEGLRAAAAARRAARASNAVIAIHPNTGGRIAPPDAALPPAGIRTTSAKRAEEQCGEWLKSMRKLGLLSPIGVRMVADKPRLVYGRHRLAAAQPLGWSEIDCQITEADDRRARMTEIAENLHRAELTALQRSEQIAEWVRLVDGLPLPRRSYRGETGDRRAAPPGSCAGGLDPCHRDDPIAANDRERTRIVQFVWAAPNSYRPRARHRRGTFDPLSRSFPSAPRRPMSQSGRQLVKRRARQRYRRVIDHYREGFAPKPTFITSARVKLKRLYPAL